MRGVRLLAGLVLVGGLAPACRQGPTYVREPVAVPEGHRGAEDPATAASMGDLPWWEVFHDPVLVRLVGVATTESQDLRIAAARIAAARSLVSVARSERFPQVDLEAEASRTRNSAKVITQGPRIRNDFSVATPISWELDVWGRVAKETEAAVARWAEQAELRRDVLRLLVADVAQAYFELRDLDLELAISRDTVGTREKTLDLFTKKFEGQQGSRLEVARAEADRAAAAAEVPRLRQAIEEKENQISLLLGRLPGPVERGAALRELTLPPAVPAGLPSSLLTRRPDVRAAEADLVARSAEIGVARADFFPRITLTGLLGLESRDLSTLVSADATKASFGASLLGPIFDAGRRRGNLAAAEARFLESRATYVRTTQIAFQETADALAAVRHLRDVRLELERRVKALEEAVAISWSRYEAGLATYFEVLDAQRELFPARLAAARTVRDQWIAIVQLYRALGGGWTEPAAPLACPPPPPPPAR